MAKDQVSVEITVEEKQALKALAQLTRATQNYEKQTVASVKRSDVAFGSFFGSLAANAASKAFGAIISGAKDLAVASLEAAASTEKIRTQLEILTGSQEKAASLYRELTEFSASTPFNLQGIAEASAQLISFGFEADTVRDRIAKIGDVAAGSGSDLKEIALIYGQVAAAGKLTGERLLQFQERAIPIGPAIAKTMNIAEKEVREFVSAGKIGFADFERAFNSMSATGGIFEGAIQKQSETINGVLSTLSDNFFILQSKIGEAFAPDIINGAKNLTSALQSLGTALEDDSKGFGLFASIVSETIGNITGFAGELIRTKTPMEEINEELAGLIDRQQELNKESKEAKESIGDYFGLFDANQQMFIENTAKKLNTVKERIEELEAARQRLIKAEEVERKKSEDQSGTGTGSSESIDGREGQEAQVNEKVKALRKQLYIDLAAIDMEAKIAQQEIKLAQGEMDSEQRAAEIQRLTEFENEKAMIAYNAETQKNKQIEDATARHLANQKAASALTIQIAKNEANEKKKLQELEDQIFSIRLRAMQGFLSAGMALAKKGSIEQKALQTAIAVTSTYSAATQALATPPGPPATYPLAASVIAQGFANIAKINSQSFATGGVVDGFNGASMGGDNRIANVRSGEMILNASQQRQLFDMANNRGGDNQQPQNIQITSIVQVDEREIARAVRNQKLEGFAV